MRVIVAAAKLLGVSAKARSEALFCRLVAPCHDQRHHDVEIGESQDMVVNSIAAGGQG